MDHRLIKWTVRRRNDYCRNENVTSTTSVQKSIRVNVNTNVYMKLRIIFLKVKVAEVCHIKH
jgi:hypothetical protein